MPGGFNCRVHRTDKETYDSLKDLLKDKRTTLYGVHHSGKKLTIRVIKYEDNDEGYLITFTIDVVKKREDWERPDEPYVRYYERCYMQVFDTPEFKNNVAIFGPNHDRIIFRFIGKMLYGKSSEYRFRLLKVEFTPENIISIVKKFPNVQNYNITDIREDDLERFAASGNNLEGNDTVINYTRNVDVRGKVKRMGIVYKDKTIFIKSDGSIFSRVSFAKISKAQIVHELYEYFDRQGVFAKPLEIFQTAVTKRKSDKKLNYHN